MEILVPIVAIVFALSIPIVAIITEYLKRRLAARERMLAIEKGVELPPLEVEETVRREKTPLLTLRSGLVWLGVGAGLTIFSLIYDIWFFHGLVLAGGLVRLFVGLALILWAKYAMKQKKSS